MKKTFVEIFVFIAIFLLGGQAYAGLITVDFDGVGNLDNSVFGFQANYELRDVNGDLVVSLTNSDLTVYYNQYYDASVPGVVASTGALPGIDMSGLGPISPTTDWIVEHTPSGDAVLGYTLGADSLVTGVLFSLMVPEGLTLTFTDWELADATGDPETFEWNRNFVVNQDSDRYTISAVPIPGALWLLGSGLFGLVAIRRRQR